jgi:cytosine/adenosine deaminase-related metal-dependent hydrolase
VCWCPASNLYLYDRTANIRALLEAQVNVTLGTDSTVTGGLNLLDEARIGRSAYRALLGEDPPARWLVELMTLRAAYALMLQDRRGRIEVGYEADLVAVRDGGRDPYTTLVDAEPADIALVIRGGTPVYGDEAFLPLFEQFTPTLTRVAVLGRLKLVVGDLPGLLDRMSEKAGKPIEFPFMPCAPIGAEGHAS